MSTTSYNFNATIDNQLKVSLKPISPQPTLVSGTVTNRPVEIPAGSQKNLYVEGGDSPSFGSEGVFTYYADINNNHVEIQFHFRVNNAGQNYAKVRDDKGIINVKTSPYSNGDHPLEVTHTLSLAK